MTQPSTEPVDLAAIAARADAATPGPWHHTDESLERYVASHDDTMYISFGCKDPGTIADAEFVAHARTDIPALLARVTDLENRLRLAHQARRAKEHQLDDIRRALCDADFMQDNDPYGHADLADVIRQVEAADRDGRTTTTEALAAELHRRNLRLTELRADRSTPDTTVHNVRGEVLGLQVALGISLGHPATGDDGLKASRAYYIQWLERQNTEAQREGGLSA